MLPLAIFHASHNPFRGAEYYLLKKQPNVSIQKRNSTHVEAVDIASGFGQHKKIGGGNVGIYEAGFKKWGESEF
jgi:hypothetical protein